MKGKEKMNKESFVFYKCFYDAIKTLPKESQLELYNAICEYALNGNVPDLSNKLLKSMFALIIPIIDEEENLEIQ